MLVKDPA